MLIDHLGVLYFPGDMVWRTIGRIAFPIFSYQLALGFLHTSNRRKYRSRLLLFGLIAQIPYMLLNPELKPNYFVFNVILLFWFATFVLQVYEQVVKSFKENNRLIYGSVMALLLIILVLLPQIIQIFFHDFGLSYGTYGLMMILMFFIVGQRPIRMVIGYLIVSILGVTLSGMYSYYTSNNVPFMDSFLNLGFIWNFMVNYQDSLFKLSNWFFQARSFMAIPIIILFEYLKPRFKMDKRVGYYFYPIHINILILFRLILQINF